MVRFAKLGALSAYTHSEAHLQQKTLHGALVTICGVLLAIFLFAHEFQACMHKTVKQKLQVQLTRQDVLHVNFNISFPSLPCQAVNVELRDVSGEEQGDGNLARGGGVHKVRIDRYGNRLGVDYIYPGRQLDFAALARDQQIVDELEQALNSHEGCNLYGIMHMRRVAGSVVMNIHIEDFFGLPENMARIKSALKRQQQHHEPEAHPDTGLQVDLDQTRINVSHTINDISFGPSFPGLKKPLEGVQRIADQPGGVYRYYLKIVPTKYKPLKGKPLNFANQYSVTEYYSPNRPGSGRLPGVYLLYDFSPVEMELEETRTGIGHLLVRLCAVIGGLFAVTGMIDRWVHRLVTSITQPASKSKHHFPGGAAPGPAPFAGGPASFGGGPTSFPQAPDSYGGMQYNGSSVQYNGGGQAVGMGSSYYGPGNAGSYTVPRGPSSTYSGYGSDKRAY